ncbi:uncharacterized protein NEMAJ01_1752 [Nematocida major]|uniref:uncharacterized protein n=1 Tax=Nematocida major TaxID=1912982 RepID=UPI002007D9F0|nr:uncharacterized protein NEMAJ01_1752 [Nematocida major]KAH9386856.1 hypothetical protein NEMAJ01_1752 [Nematocida major]
MGADEKILERSPILYMQDKNALYSRLIQSKYTTAQVDKLFGELHKYGLLYFFGLSVGSELSRAYSSCKEESYTEKCFASYHLRNRNSMYAEEPGSGFDELFLHGYCKYLRGEYARSRDCMETLLRQSMSGGSVHFGCRLHILSIASASAYRMGGYYDAVWLARAGMALAEAVGFEEGSLYFERMLRIIEGMKNGEACEEEFAGTLISRDVNSLLRIPTTMEDKIERCLRYGSEVSLLRDVKIYDTREGWEMSSTIEEYINRIKGIGDKCQDVSPVVVYSIDGCLAFGLIYFREKAKMSVIKSKILVKQILHRLGKIQAQNQEVLRRECATAEEKQEWWKARISLDAEIKKEVLLIDGYLQKYIMKGHKIKPKVALVIEDILGCIPFEMCNTFTGAGVFRCSSLCHILSGVGASESSGPVEDSEIFYILNPEKNLAQTEERIAKYLEENMPGASGIRNRPPLPMEAEQAMASHRVFMYFGHGGGEKFFTPRKLRKLSKGMEKTRCKSIFLFGCSSAKISAFPMYNTHSTCISYMHIPIVKNVIGALWDVTDKDLDLVSVGVMDAVKNQKELLSVALNRLKRQCKLKYLNGAALVIYGIDE